ncbi:sulfite exporter TauE/SafE family protein [Galliscardovia ingluviei]|uniref:sulfite exporter TauE/SafE family protein n=1 Tax=Galliscardovia ingluviei TaxID=1769422 RepID=UPI0016659841|nr:sulfite exporter TauE/SafE family protein [Galliscardovia ingluviei]
MGNLILSIFVGLGVGIVVGALGAGGGILSVPVLVYLLGQEPHAASMGSLVIVGLTALVSIIPRQREGHIRWRDGLIFGLLSSIGTICGSRISVYVPSDILMILFSILLAVVGVLMLNKAVRARRLEREDLAHEEQGTQNEKNEGNEQNSVQKSAQKNEYLARDPNHRSKQKTSNAKQSLLLLMLCSSLTGLLTGFFGVGGGFAVVPMLVLALGFSVREASSTSLIVMIIASAVGLISRVDAHIHVDWIVVLSFAAASMLGGLIGAPTSRHVRESTLTMLFGILLLVVAIGTAASSILS